MHLHDVNSGIKRFTKIKRRGRGIGSGHGKTATRGHKGQFGRSGVSFHPAFQGGAMPLVRRIPKRGFNNKFAWEVGEVNLSRLETRYAAGETVSPESLKAKAILKRRCDLVKVLGTGEVTKPLTLQVHRISESAKQKIEKAGGTVTLLSLPGQPLKKPAAKAKGKSPKKSAPAKE